MTTMNRKLFYVLSLLVLLFAADPYILYAQGVLPAPGPADDPALSPEWSAHPVQISAGDLIDLIVFDTPELSGKLRVDDKGRISLPVAGELPVSGMTAAQASRAIESKFLANDILKDPHVSISIAEYATQGVTILGEVKNPGIYPLLGVRNVLDLISAAGGFTATAGKQVTLTHRNHAQSPLVVSLEPKSGNAAAFNLDVNPGDTITVERVGLVYVLGDVAKPGGFVIEGKSRLTVLQALALAQGTNSTAALNGARLLRNTDDGREEISVPLKRMMANKASDPVVFDGDILVVPSSAAKNTLKVMESILPAVAAAAIYRVP